MTRIGELEMFSESLGTTHLPLTMKRGRWKHEPQAWGARYQDTGMQFLKLYFPNISFSGAARRWSKDVVAPRKSRQFNRAYLKAAYQIAHWDVTLIWSMNWLYFKFLEFQTCLVTNSWRPLEGVEFCVLLRRQVESYNQNRLIVMFRSWL